MSGRGKKPAAPRKKANGYKMPAPIANGEIIHDTRMKKKWRIGPSIGVGGFGEIYSACDHDSSPKKGSSFPFVIKIEPHENGPLFVEKHFYIRNANKDDIAKYMKDKKLSSLGMPTYFGNGTHEYNGEKYRYLVLERYGKDLWSLFKDCGRSFPAATVFQLGLQMLDVLEYIHSRGYVHADLKGANILLGLRKGTENQAYLVDYGLAARVTDKEFKPDPKCAHNGTIEYTSRDAHLGVATMRGDLEILGYNMVQWLVGRLPWETKLSQPKAVQDMKEAFMRNVRDNITKQFNNVPEALIKFFEYINTMKPKDVPDYAKCRALFESYLKTEGKTRSSKLDFTTNKKGKAKPGGDASNDSQNVDTVDAPAKKLQNGDVPKKRSKKPKVKQSTDSENCENETPQDSIDETVKRRKKRKSTDPSLIVKVKKPKIAVKAATPVNKNLVNTATQTSLEKVTDKIRKSPRKSPRKVVFDSPICEIMGEGERPAKRSKNSSQETINSSGDIFEDSFVIEEKKVKPKRKLLSDKVVTVKRIVKKKVTKVDKPKPRSWKDLPTVVNGRSPPK